jgi:GAF domain-containing protein
MRWHLSSRCSRAEPSIGQNVRMGLLLRNRRDDFDVASCLANLDRLGALRESGLLDAPPSDRLDALTRDAAKQLGTPMAFMSLVDEQRVFFASALGLSDAMAETRENSVEGSYCQYVVVLDDVLVVNDSLTDPLVSSHPATTDGAVRSYLGVPLRRAGHCIGSFCVVDERPRQWSDDDLATLQALAAAAMQGAR